MSLRLQDIICISRHTALLSVCTFMPAKFFVRDNGDTVIQNRGILNDREIGRIRAFIKQNYQEMYLKWSEYSREGFYEKK